MQKMMRKMFGLGTLVLVLLFAGCATLFNNKQTTVSASSGATDEVTILENGSVVYEGPLPAAIRVSGSKSYAVQYQDKDGNARTLQLQKRLSGWFVADVLLLGGWIIDLITGNVMVYDSMTLLPVSYSDTQTGLFVDHVPSGLQDNLRVIGNIYN